MDAIGCLVSRGDDTEHVAEHAPGGAGCLLHGRVQRSRLHGRARGSSDVPQAHPLEHRNISELPERRHRCGIHRSRCRVRVVAGTGVEDHERPGSEDVRNAPPEGVLSRSVVHPPGAAAAKVEDGVESERVGDVVRERLEPRGAVRSRVGGAVRARSDRVRVAQDDQASHLVLGACDSLPGGDDDTREAGDVRRLHLDLASLRGREHQTHIDGA